MSWLSNIFSDNNNSIKRKTSCKSPAVLKSSLALIIDRREYQVAELAVRSFRIKPYDGGLVVKQCFAFTMVLTMGGQQGRSLGRGLVRTINDREGLVAQFREPSPAFNKNLMKHLASRQPSIAGK